MHPLTLLLAQHPTLLLPLLRGPITTAHHLITPDHPALSLHLAGTLSSRERSPIHFSGGQRATISDTLSARGRTVTLDLDGHAPLRAHVPRHTPTQLAQDALTRGVAYGTLPSIDAFLSARGHTRAELRNLNFTPAYTGGGCTALHATTPHGYTVALTDLTGTQAPIHPAFGLMLSVSDQPGTEEDSLHLLPQAYTFHLLSPDGQRLGTLNTSHADENVRAMLEDVDRLGQRQVNHTVTATPTLPGGPT